MSILKVNTLQNTSGTTLNLVKQVVEGSTNTEVIVATTTYTDTGLTASITPSSTSSKILVLISQSYGTTRSVGGLGMGVKIFRGSTAIYEPIASAIGPFSFYSSGTALYGRACYSILDSPATTSSVTYKTQGRPYVTGNSGLVTFQDNESGTAGTSYIQLIEVAA